MFTLSCMVDVELFIHRPDHSLVQLTWQGIFKDGGETCFECITKAFRNVSVVPYLDMCSESAISTSTSSPDLTVSNTDIECKSSSGMKLNSELVTTLSSVIVGPEPIREMLEAKVGSSSECLL
ncbi:hypothetical protein Tco_1193021 [Tanacetum coccineum]